MTSSPAATARRYDRRGTANTDVVLLESCPPPPLDDAVGGAGRMQLRSEWVGTRSTRLVLDPQCGVARVVARFAIEHVKRRSGKNNLLEGQRSADDTVAASI